MQVKKQQLELDMEKWTASELGKEYVKAVYCHPAYLIYIEYVMQNARLDKSQTGIKIAGRNISNLRCADDTTLNGRKWKGTKEPLDKGEREEWKGWLQTQH